MGKHPVLYIKRAFATFLALGHHDMLLRRLARTYGERLPVWKAALDAHLPEVRHALVTGSAPCLVEGPPWLDATHLAADAQEAGILIERRCVFFMNDDSNARRCFWIGFSAIPLSGLSRAYGPP